MLPERGGGEGGPCPRPSGVIRPRDQPGGRRSWAPSHRWGCHPCPCQALPPYRNLPLQPVPSGTCLSGRKTKMRLLGRWDLQPLNAVRFDRHPARTPPISDPLDRDLPGGGPAPPGFACHLSGDLARARGSTSHTLPQAHSLDGTGGDREEGGERGRQEPFQGGTALPREARRPRGRGASLPRRPRWPLVTHREAAFGGPGGAQLLS